MKGIFFPAFAGFLIFVGSPISSMLLAGTDVHTSWVRHYHGPDSFSVATAMAVDQEGCVYVTGWAQRTRGDRDFTTVKYSASGEEQWTKLFDGPTQGNDEPMAIAIDGWGNVYVTGFSQAAGSSMEYDYTTVKYSPEGVELWVMNYGGSVSETRDIARDLELDPQGNVYITGTTMRDTGGEDFLTVKYSPDGTEEWNRSLALSSNNHAMVIAIDDSGNVHVAGGRRSSPDNFITTVKYTSTGEERWRAHYRDAEYPSAIALSPWGDVYVTGYYYSDFTFNEHPLTIKYGKEGNHVTTFYYSSSGNANSVAVNSAGEVAVVGYLWYGSHHFNDWFAAVYSPVDTLKWSITHDIRMYEEQALDVAMDVDGNVYVTGVVADFDYWGEPKFATVRYDSTGQLQWEIWHSGPGKYNVPVGLALDDSGNVYVAGTTGEAHYWGGELPLNWIGGTFTTVKYIQRLPDSEIGPMDLAIGVHQNTHTTECLNLYMLSSHFLKSLEFEVNEVTHFPQLIDTGENLWGLFGYKLTPSLQTVRIDACGTSRADSTTCVSYEFATGLVTQEQGGIVSSLDGGLELVISAHSIKKDGYILVLPDDPAALDQTVELDSLGKIAPPRNSMPGEVVARYRTSPSGLLTGTAWIEFDLSVLHPVGVLDLSCLGIRDNSGELLRSFYDPNKESIGAQITDFGTYELILGANVLSRTVETNVLILEPNYPNPFNPNTTISFEVAAFQHVTLEVFDVSGRKVVTLLDRVMSPGNHCVSWDGRSSGGSTVASGVYFLRANAGESYAVRKMLLVR